MQGRGPALHLHGHLETPPSLGEGSVDPVPESRARRRRDEWVLRQVLQLQSLSPRPRMEPGNGDDGPRDREQRVLQADRPTRCRLGDHAQVGGALLHRREDGRAAPNLQRYLRARVYERSEGLVDHVEQRALAERQARWSDRLDPRQLAGEVPAALLHLATEREGAPALLGEDEPPPSTAVEGHAEALAELPDLRMDRCLGEMEATSGRREAPLFGENDEGAEEVEVGSRRSVVHQT